MNHWGIVALVVAWSLVVGLLWTAVGHSADSLIRPG
jgi:hypothetical protein